MTRTRRILLLVTSPLWLTALLVACVIGSVLLGVVGVGLLAISFFQEP